MKANHELGRCNRGTITFTLELARSFATDSHRLLTKGVHPKKCLCFANGYMICGMGGVAKLRPGRAHVHRGNVMKKIEKVCSLIDHEGFHWLPTE